MIDSIQTERNFSSGELIAYVTGWALLGACFTVKHDDSVLTSLALLGLLTLPGALVAGAIGFAFGGRRMFLPAVLCGTSTWMLVNVIFAIRIFGG